MGTLTAQILVGTPHPNHGGINPTHCMFLSENSRPAWVITPLNVFQEDRNVENKIIWIPTLEDMLEDAFLMIAIHVKRNHEIIEMARSFYAETQSARLELYEHFNDSQRKLLYEKCRQLSDFPKIIISVFETSTIQGQLKIVGKYNMDVEVCCPTYSRLFSEWSNETSIEGSLE
ncbi:hypothetical protein HYY75_09590 [bacterium]|nr:hypothetical protein [bacterium]